MTDAPTGASARVILAGLTTILVVRLLLCVAVIPPWQHPDEPAHLARASIYARQTSLRLSEREDPAIERVLLASMSEHGWWESYGLHTPVPPPVSFSHPEVRGHVLRQSDASALYYVPAAFILKTLGLTDPVAQLYALRSLSALLAVPTLWCVWSGTRRLFGVEAATGAAAVVAWHPQFALLSSAVHPEALVNLCGAVVWWQGARLIGGDRELTGVLALVAAILVGVFTKRVGAPMIAVGVLMILAGVLVGRREARRGWVLAGGAFGAAVLVGLALVPEAVSRVWHYWSELLLLPAELRPRDADLEYLMPWGTGLFQSAWLYAGWLRYPAPAAWYYTIAGLSLLSAIGLVPAWVRLSASARVGVCLAVGWVVVQAAAVYVGFFRNGLPAQGHYFFSLIGPWATLFWLGIAGWCPRRLWPVTAWALIIGLAVLDLCGWGLVLAPAYLG